MNSPVLAIDTSRDKSTEKTRRAAVLAGLRKNPPRLSPIWFYDRHGSELFERICELPEYYLTRTELAIMHRHAAGIADALGPGVALIEPGSGASRKTRLLLDNLAELTAYVPVDVSREHLIDVAGDLRRSYPALDIRPVCEDFTKALSIPPAVLRSARRRVVYFPGSTIGNFERPEAIRLMSQMRRTVGRNGLVLLGFDRVKDIDVLERAYDDAAGVTAQFNLNALRHLNQAMNADFDLDAFAHRAAWVPEHSRIEMHLRATRDLEFSVAGESFSLARDEYLLTEYSHKYTMQDAGDMAGAAGMGIREAWSDPDEWFTVLLLAPES
jgi:dimethylhistidine N-methyltransferase